MVVGGAGWGVCRGYIVLLCVVVGGAGCVCVGVHSAGVWDST